MVFRVTVDSFDHQVLDFVSWDSAAYYCQQRVRSILHELKSIDDLDIHLVVHDTKCLIMLGKEQVYGFYISSC